MTFRTLIRTTLSVLAVATIATPALATDEDVPTVEVLIGDLDLSKLSGQETMNKRIKVAARKICETSIPGAQGRTIEVKCIRQALENSKPQMEQAIASANMSQPTELALNMTK